MCSQALEYLIPNCEIIWEEDGTVRRSSIAGKSTSLGAGPEGLRSCSTSSEFTAHLCVVAGMVPWLPTLLWVMLFSHSGRRATGKASKQPFSFSYLSNKIGRKEPRH